MKPKKIVAWFLIACCVLGGSMTSASGLSDITGIDINIPAGTITIGTPNPGAIPRVIENLPKDVGQALLNPAGAALAVAIRHAAEQARHGSRPIPPEIRQVLAPFFPAYVLDGTSWNLYDPNRITLDSAIIGMFHQDNAITLDNIVVFPDMEAAGSWDLWSHELVHALQYRNMGVEGFANIYSFAWESLEQDARHWQQQIRGRVQQQWANQTQPANWQSQQFYSVAPGAASRTLTDRDFARAAQAYYPAESCAVTSMTMQALYIENTCPIPIRVTGWRQQNPWNGALVPILCVNDCWVAPGANKPFWSQAPGPIVTIGYSYN